MTNEKDNLEIMQNADRYNQWIYNNIKKHLSNSILEIGGGLGAMTKYLLKCGKVTSTDIDQVYIDDLNDQFNHHDFEAINYDISKYDTTNLRGFKVVVCINVLEHIEADQIALRNMYDVLKPNSKVVLVCPAHPWLYGPIDKSDNHYRRYSKKDLKQKLEKVGFKNIKLKYMNFPGFIGWYYHNKILKLQKHKKGDITLFNKLVPLFEFIENIVPCPIGLSIIATGDKE